MTDNKYKDEYDDVYITEQHMQDISNRLEKINGCKRVISNLDTLINFSSGNNTIRVSDGNVTVIIRKDDLDTESYSTLLKSYKSLVVNEKKEYLRLNPEHKDY